jgi:hypothetical protein
MPPRAYAARRSGNRSSSSAGRGPAAEKKEPAILFQQFFKSVGPRTYVAQVKQANNGNHFLVLTEGKRDEKTAEVRKTRLFVYSEDFPAFFRLVKAAAEFIKVHPVDPKVVAKREKYWAKQDDGRGAPPRPVEERSMPAPTPATPPQSVADTAGV